MESRGSRRRLSWLLTKLKAGKTRQVIPLCFLASVCSFNTKSRLAQAKTKYTKEKKDAVVLLFHCNKSREQNAGLSVDTKYFF